MLPIQRVEAGPAGEKTAAWAAAQAAAHEFVGEVGLDFSRAHASTRAAQLCAFDRIVAACAAQPRAGRVVSIHAVHAATEALDILERHGLPAHATCIFHWFSGSGEDLNCLRALGCLVSVNECMLATRRGRAYARQLPEDALLLETDAPAWLDAPPLRRRAGSLARPHALPARRDPRHLYANARPRSCGDERASLAIVISRCAGRRIAQLD